METKKPEGYALSWFIRYQDCKEESQDVVKSLDYLVERADRMLRDESGMVEFGIFELGRRIPYQIARGDQGRYLVLERPEPEPDLSRLPVARKLAEAKAEVARLEGEARIELLEKIVNRILDYYLAQPAKAAELVDKTIDPSGNLLGWIRDAHHLRRQMEKK